MYNEPGLMMREKFNYHGRASLPFLLLSFFSYAQDIRVIDIFLLSLPYA